MFKSMFHGSKLVRGSGIAMAVSCVAAVAVVANGAPATAPEFIHNFTESGVYNAPKTGHPVTTNTCGVARCVELVIYLPLTAQNIKPHCYVNIKPNTTDDLPHGQLAEVGCGVDTAWSIFDEPIVQTTPTNVVVRTVFHNRSDNRDRDMKLVAEWTAAAPVVK